MDRQGAHLTESIVAKAVEYGADLAGVAAVEEVERSPSHRIYPLLDPYAGVGTKDVEGREPGRVDWPPEAASVVVVAVRHAEASPGLDWWRDGQSGGTEGNRRLMDVTARLARWLVEDVGVAARPLAYHIEHGGVFLKDAAALAGLGVIGRNNLLITPDFGPRVRLRCLTIDRRVVSTGPSPFDPCEGCAMPCRSACPQGAMDAPAHTADRYGLDLLPGRDGSYSRVRCNLQMEADVAGRETVPRPDTGEPGTVVRYCRECEFACWVGAGA